MTDQLNPAITDLVAAGRDKLSKRRADYQARQDAEAAKRRASIDAQLANLNLALVDLLPAALQAYCTLLANPEQDLNSREQARLEVDGLSPILITFERNSTWNGTEYLYTFTPWKEDGGHPLFEVTKYTLQKGDDDLWFVADWSGYREDRHYGSNDLDIALALAAEQWANHEKLTAEAQQKNLAAEVKQAVRQTAIDQRQRHATTEREALLDLLSDDPVLLALLKVAIAVKQERAGYVESIDNLHAAIETQDESYQRRLDEKQREAVQAVRNAKDEADRSQREADDLQAKLARLKRQAQYA